jgi:cytochrome c
MVNIRRFSPALAMAVLLLWPISLQAQEPDFDLKPNEKESKVPDVANGEVLAHKLCVGCHVLEPGADNIPQADVPSFQAIADRPNQTQETLTTWLLEPHAPMPDPHLSRTEIRDLAGYIVSLRKTP